MKIWHHRYVLNSTWHGTDHSGALLKVEFADGKCGHADLHPWPALGDPDLTQVLAGLASERPWPILNRLLAIAAEDAAARAKSISLYTGHLFPSSHKLLPPLESLTAAQLEHIAKQDYRFVKAKLGKNLIEETKALKTLVEVGQLKWRLDFNGRLTASEFVAWVKDVSGWLTPHLDGIEDPVAADEVPQLTPHWTNAKWSEGISLMSDRVQLGMDGTGFVIKPEIQPLDPKAGRRWVTNNLGHPYGHGVALAYAARWGDGEVGGLQGLDEYASGGRMKAWREQIRYHGPLTLPPSGTGFGFDQLLGKLPWKTLR